MEELLREALLNCDSVRAVAKAAGVENASLYKFRDGQRSLRLDLADRVAAHFGIVCLLPEDRGSAVKPRTRRKGAGL